MPGFSSGSQSRPSALRRVFRSSSVGMVQGRAGDGFRPLGKVLIPLPLAERIERIERNGVRVRRRPLHKLPELDPIEAGGLLHAMGSTRWAAYQVRNSPSAWRVPHRYKG